MNKVVVAVLIVAAFIAGNATGFFAGVASVDAGKSFLEDLVTLEQNADVKNPKSIDRPAFTMSYPGNWKVDDKDEDYDADHLFSLESPGSAVVTFSMSDVAMPHDDLLASQREMIRKLMPSPTETPITRWGKYEGQGMRLEGRMLGMKGTIAAFVTTQGERTVYVMTQWFDEDRTMVGPGFELIEKSFTLR